MSLLERKFSRREFLEKSLKLPFFAAVGAVLGISCSQEKPIPIPDAIENIIENDIGQTGLRRKGWYELVPFQDLEYKQRVELGNLPESGLFTFDSDKNLFSFVFFTLEERTGRGTYLKITDSISRMKKQPTSTNDLPMVEIELDLSKFVIPKDKGLEIVKYSKAEDYLKVYGSIASISLKGNCVDLEPFIDKIP